MRLFFALTITLVLTITSIEIHAQELKMSSWNMEWLTTNPNHKVYEAKRESKDFTALKSYFDDLNADVIAFQEVDSFKAMQKISSADYHIVFSDRYLPQHSNHTFSDINQFTGFAIRNNVPFSDPEDIDLYGKGNHKLRFAAYVILNPDSKTPVHTLSVHLKAGCTAKFYSTKKACQSLLTQGKKLNQWIKQREALQQEYVIMGDFNHNLSYNDDWLWKELTREVKQTPDLVSRHTKSECKVRKRNDAKNLHQFRTVIDHIIVSKGLSASPAQQTVYNGQDVLQYHLSDHCPISTQLSW